MDTATSWNQSNTCFCSPSGTYYICRCSALNLWVASCLSPSAVIVGGLSDACSQSQGRDEESVTTSKLFQTDLSDPSPEHQPEPDWILQHNPPNLQATDSPSGNAVVDETFWVSRHAVGAVINSNFIKPNVLDLLAVHRSPGPSAPSPSLQSGSFRYDPLFSTSSDIDWTCPRQTISLPACYLQHQTLEEFKKDTQRNCGGDEVENTFKEWMFGSQKRPPAQAPPPDHQWGSDSNFNPCVVGVQQESDALPRERQKIKTEIPDGEADKNTDIPKGSGQGKPKSEHAVSALLLPMKRVARKRLKSGLKGSAQKSLSEEQKRQQNKLKNQKRRSLINQGFEDLRNLVPELRGREVSKADLLLAAAKWLEDLLRSNEALAAQLASLEGRGCTTC